MSFPDYEALRFESQPAISGSGTRLMLLRRGAGVERERIVKLLESEMWDDPQLAAPFVTHIVGLIEKEND